MSDKKVKIDLKARLGRASKTASGIGGGPPSAGIIPPPGIITTGGIPAPPFATQPKKPAGPTIDKDDAFATVSASEVAPKAQEIKVEISHEAVQAQKKGFINIIIAAVITGAVGAAGGYFYGGVAAGTEQDQIAVRDAQSLIEPIDKAREVAETLQEKIDAATKTLFVQKKFPEDLSKELNDIHIAFSANDLGGKALHRLKRSLVREIFDFARDAQELEERKGNVRRLFDARKKAITELLDLANNPQIGYGVFVQKDKEGNAVGTFVPLKTPYRFEEKTWPDEFDLTAGNEIVKGTRYKKGDPFVVPPRREGEKATVYTIPLEPDGITKAFPNELSNRIESELKAIRTLIVGTNPGGEVVAATDQDKPGLVKLAQKIIEELRAVGAKR
ncbi:MAG: hypothetical protein FWD57_11955 [Polyangiaceae bacterium]|nr:hypothetical protein [Polyangiaceae bacterium]